MTTFLEKLDELESQSRKAIQIEKRYEGLPVNIPEMYIRPDIVLKLIEALKNSTSVLMNFINAANLRYENPCDHKQECDWICEHVKDASEVLQEIEGIFK